VGWPSGRDWERTGIGGGGGGGCVGSLCEEDGVAAEGIEIDDDEADEADDTADVVADVLFSDSTAD
jgi:hypothetical protein